MRAHTFATVSFVKFRITCTQLLNQKGCGAFTHCGALTSPDAWVTALAAHSVTTDSAPPRAVGTRLSVHGVKNTAVGCHFLFWFPSVAKIGFLVTNLLLPDFCLDKYFQLIGWLLYFVRTYFSSLQSILYS